MELVRGDDHGKRIPNSTLSQPEVTRLRERAEHESPDASKALGCQPDGLGWCARRAHCTPGTRQVADETVRRAALDTSVQVRVVSGEPEQLELEAECERVETTPPPQSRGMLSTTLRNRVSASNARSFCSCST